MFCALYNCLEIKQLYRDGVHLYGRAGPRTPTKTPPNNTILKYYTFALIVQIVITIFF